MSRNKRISNFPKELRMDLACTTDELRPAMQCIYFENGFAYASNGYILVKNKLSECTGLQPEEIAALNGKKIHRKSYKQILKYDYIRVTDVGIEAKEVGREVLFYFDYPDIKFPDAESVLQKSIEKEKALKEEKTKIPAIGLKPYFINIIDKALFGGDVCKFTFTKESNAIIVSKSNSESIGVIMTCNIKQ